MELSAMLLRDISVYLRTASLNFHLKNESKGDNHRHSNSQHQHPDSIGKILHFDHKLTNSVPALKSPKNHVFDAFCSSGLFKREHPRRPFCTVYRLAGSRLLCSAFNYMGLMNLFLVTFVAGFGKNYKAMKKIFDCCVDGGGQLQVAPRKATKVRVKWMSFEQAVERSKN